MRLGFITDNKINFRRVLTPVLIFALIICGLFITKAKVKAADQLTLNLTFYWDGFFPVGTAAAINYISPLPVNASRENDYYEDSNYSGGGYYLFTIPANALSTYPIVYENYKPLGSSEAGNSHYITGFTLSDIFSGNYNDEVQTIALASGAQTVKICKSAFPEGTDSNNVTVKAVRSVNLTSAIKKVGAMGSSFAFPLAGFDEGNANAIYNVTIPAGDTWDHNLPTNYTAGSVNTVIRLITENVVVKNSENEVVTEMRQEQSYSFYVPFSRLSDLEDGFEITTTPELSLNVTYDTGTTGSLSQGAASTVTSTLITSGTDTPYWQINVSNVPTVTLPDGYYLRGWSVAENSLVSADNVRYNGVVIMSNNGFVARVTNEAAQANSNLTLPLVARYTHVNGGYSINPGAHGGSYTGASSISFEPVGYNSEKDRTYFKVNLPTFTAESGWILDKYVISGIPDDAPLYRENGENSISAFTNNMTKFNPGEDTLFVMSEYADELNLTFTALYKSGCDVTFQFYNGNGGSFVSGTETRVAFTPTEHVDDGNNSCYVGKVTLPEITPIQGKVLLGYKYNVNNNNIVVHMDGGRMLYNFAVMAPGEHDFKIYDSSLPADQSLPIGFVAYYADEGYPISLECDGVAMDPVLSDRQFMNGSLKTFAYTISAPTTHTNAATGGFAQGWKRDIDGYTYLTFSDGEECGSGNIIMDGEQIKYEVNITNYSLDTGNWADIKLISVNNAIKDSGTYTFGEAGSDEYYLYSGNWQVGDDGYTYSVPRGLEIFAPQYETLTFTKQ